MERENILPIVNLDNLLCVNKEQEVKRHGPLLPNHVRALICGPSNCGKTNVLLNLIFAPQGLSFKNIYIFSKTLYQPKYQFLKQVLSNLPEIGYFPFSEHDKVVHPNNIRPFSLMIFDDVSCEKQDHIRDYFTMGRHKNVDTFYLCQTYSKIPKQLIRDNSNFILIFKQDETNLRHIYRDLVNTDMSYDQFKDLCHRAWSTKKGFLTIERERDIDNGRYRNMLDDFFSI